MNKETVVEENVDIMRDIAMRVLWQYGAQSCVNVHDLIQSVATKLLETLKLYADNPRENLIMTQHPTLMDVFIDELTEAMTLEDRIDQVPDWRMGPCERIEAEQLFERIQEAIASLDHDEMHAVVHIISTPGVARLTKASEKLRDRAFDKIKKQLESVI